MSYAKLAEVQHGTKLIADGGFTCIRKGALLEARLGAGDCLYVPCRKGKHYLSGQLNERGYLVGFTLAEGQGR